ncbi:MAG: HEAT repeat domain-containing protein [Holosporaceae bacterium]|jgi:HEAT repeat protein
MSEQDFNHFLEMDEQDFNRNRESVIGSTTPAVAENPGNDPEMLLKNIFGRIDICDPTEYQNVREQVNNEPIFLSACIKIMLSDSYQDNRCAAILTLEPLASTNEDVLDGLITAAREDTSWRVRQWAIQALDPLTEHNEKVQNLMIRVAERDDTWCNREQAIDALGPLVSTEDTVKDLMIRVATNKNEQTSVRSSAVSHLGQLAPMNDLVKTMMMRQLATDSNPSVRGMAVKACGLVAKDDRVRCMLLSIARTDAAPNVRRKAVEALIPLVGDDRDVLDLMKKAAVNDKDPSIREKATGALISLVSPQQPILSIFPSEVWPVLKVVTRVSAVSPVLKRVSKVSPVLKVFTGGEEDQASKIAIKSFKKAAITDKNVCAIWLEIPTQEAEKFLNAIEESSAKCGCAPPLSLKHQWYYDQLQDAPLYHMKITLPKMNLAIQADGLKTPDRVYSKISNEDLPTSKELRAILNHTLRKKVEPLFTLVLNQLTARGL